MMGMKETGGVGSVAGLLGRDAMSALDSLELSVLLAMVFGSRNARFVDRDDRGDGASEETVDNEAGVPVDDGVVFCCAASFSST